MKPFEFAKTNWKMLALAAGTVILAVSVFAGLRALGSAINEHKINKLEAEKQELRKVVTESHDRELILQGEVKAKDQQIADLTSRISESNERVSNAHNETQSARANLNKVRSDPPNFNSADDAGRVREFSTAGRELYPELYPDKP